MIVYIVLHNEKRVDGVYTSRKRAETAMRQKYPNLYIHPSNGAYYTGDNDAPAILELVKLTVNAKLTNL